MQLRLIGAAFVLPFSIAVHAGDPVVLKFDSAVRYYDIRGSTASDLLEQMQTQAADAGESYFAEVSWSFNWKADFSTRTRGLCRMERLSVTAAIRTTLPRWKDSNTAPRALRDQWAAFMTGIRIHEEGHVANATRAIEEFGKEFEDLRARDCSALTKKGQELANSVTAKYAALDVEYDRATKHGVEQGAYWRARAR